MCSFPNAEKMKEKTDKNKNQVQKKEIKDAKKEVKRAIKEIIKRIKQIAKKGETNTFFWYRLAYCCKPLKKEYKDMIKNYFTLKGYQIRIESDWMGNLRISIDWSMDIKRSGINEKN